MFEKGEIIKVRDQFLEVISAEPFHYQVPADTYGTGQTVSPIEDLRPLDNELLEIRAFGIEGIVNALVQYPAGVNRNSPRNLAEYYTEETASKYSPALINLFVVPSTEPYLLINNTEAAVVTASFYFWGYRYTVREAPPTANYREVPTFV